MRGHDPGILRQRRWIERPGRPCIEDIAAGSVTAQRVGRPDCGQSSAAHERDDIAQLDLVEVLGRDQQRATFVTNPVQRGPDRLSEDRVEAGRWLVEDQEPWLVHERTGKLQPSLHPAREATGASAADVIQPDKAQHLADASAPARREQAEQARHEVDVLGHGQVRIQRELLRHVADLLTRMTPEPAGLLTQHRQPAGTRRESARDQADGGRLACP